MARFYRTDSSNPQDYMYRINAPLMRDVIATNDQYIGQNIAALDQLGSIAASFPHLQPDDQRVKEITQGYTTQVDNLTDSIRTDPANWRRQMEPIKNLSRNLVTNMKSGELSKIIGNYTQYKTVSDYIDKSVEGYSKDGKGISADRGRAYKQHFLSQFVKANDKGTSYNPETGEYNAIKVFEPMNNIDIADKLGKEMDKIKADKKLYKKDETTGNEWYFNETTNSWEGVTPEKIMNIAMSRLSDPQLMNYLRQDSQVGLMSGAVDDQGKLIRPFSYDPVKVSPEEKQALDERLIQINKVKNPEQRKLLTQQLKQFTTELEGRKSLAWNNDSSLAPIFQGLIGQYSYSQSETSNKLRDNARGRTLYTQGQINNRDTLNRKSREDLAKEREDGLNKRFKDRLDFDKYKWDNPHETKTGTAKAGTTKKTDKTKEPEKTPIETGVSQLSNNPFEDWTINDSQGKRVPVLSNDGLSTSIDQGKVNVDVTKGKVKELQTGMRSLMGNRTYDDLSVGEQKAYDAMKVTYDQLSREVPRLENQVDMARQYYKLSTDAALVNNPNAGTNLTQKEIDLYNQFKNDREGEKLSAKIRRNHDVEQLNMDYQRNGQPVVEIAPEEATAKLREEYGNYMAVKKKVDAGRENFLKSVRSQPVIGDAIDLGTKDQKELTEMIFSNTQGYKIYDNNGFPTDGRELNSKGWFSKDFNMSFVDNNLQDYLSKHNVKTKVEQVANGIKLGSGNAVAKVTFDDPNGQIPKTPFYIELSSDMQRRVGSKFLSNKNAQVSGIARNILDEEYNDIRRQLLTPTPNRVNSENLDSTDPIQSKIFIHRGNTQIPLYVTKFVSADGIDHINIQMMKDGQLVPLPLNPKVSNSGIPGWFKDPEDFINQLRTQ